MTHFLQSDSPLRFDASATLAKYPVRRQSLRGLFRSETNLDLARRNLGASVGFPRLAQVVGSPSATHEGISLKGNTDYLATDLPELATMTHFAIVRSSDTFADGLTRPMFYSNFSTEGCSLYVSAAGSEAGRGRVVANSYSVDADGARTNSQAFFDGVDLRNYICICAVHTPTQVKLYLPGSDIPAFIRNRPASNARVLAPRNMRIGSAYQGAGSFEGNSNVLFLADFAAELTASEIELIRTTELAWQAKIGSGVSF